MTSEPIVVAALEARYHKGANAESAAGGHLVVQAFTVTGNDFSTGDGVSPTIRAGADRQNTTPMVVVPVQDGRGMEKSQNGLGVGEPGDPMYTLDTTGAQAVAYEVIGDPTAVNTLVASNFTQGGQTVQAAVSGMLIPMAAIPCQVDGSPVAATLRGFGHGWQGQHNTTNAVAQSMDPNLLQVYTVHGEHSTAMTGNGDAAVAFVTDVTRCLDTTGGYTANQGGTVVAQSMNPDVAGTLDANYGKGTGERNGIERDVIVQSVWEYDGYNQKLDDSGVHRTLRIGRDSSDFVAYREDTVPTLVSEEPTTTLTASDGGSSHLQRDLVQEDENVSTSNITPSQPIAFSHYSSDPSPSSIVPTLRAGTNVCGHAVAYLEPALFEPMSLREENWTGRDVKNALRAEASKSSHAIVAIPISADAANGREGVSATPSADAEGNVRLRDPGLGVGTDGDPSYTISASSVPAVAVGNRPEPFALLNFQGSKSNTVVNDGDISFTINAMHGHDIHVVGYEHTTTEEPMTTPATNLVVRRLTPLECELLMGWDPNWTAEGVEEDGTIVKMADTHRYRMCGNGVVANVGEWIGIRYVAALAGEDE